MSDVRVRLVALFCVGLWAVLLNQAALLWGLAVVPLGLALWVAPEGRRGQVLAGVALLAWTTVLSQALFYGDLPRTAWLRLGPVVLWEQGFQYGLAQAGRLVATSAAGLAVAWSTSPDALLRGLRALGLPWAPAFLAATALRFVPVVGQEWAQARAARRARGVVGGPPWRRLQREVELVVPVLARSLRRARALAATLEMRGFDVASPPSDAMPPLKASGWAACVVLVGLSAGLLGLELAWWGYVQHLWAAPGSPALMAFARAWL